MSFYADAWWIHANRSERVAVIVGNDAPKFMSLVEFAQANQAVLDEMVSNAEGHDVCAQIFSGDDLILEGGAGPAVRITCCVKCPSCGVEAVEWAEFDGCEDPLCAGQAKGREMERLCAGAKA